MVGSRTSKRSIAIAGEPPSESVSVQRARVGAKSSKAKVKVEHRRRKSATISGTPMRRRPSDRIEHVKPVGDLPVTGGDQVEIARALLGDALLACVQTSLSDAEVASITIRSKCVELQKRAIVQP